MNVRSFRRSAFPLFLTLVTILAVLRPAAAAEPTGKPETSPAAEAKPAAEATPPAQAKPIAPDETAKPAGEDDKEKIIREQTIYVPYEKLRKVFEKEGRGVFLPYEKFRELWDAAQAKKESAADAKPPIAAVITESEHEATVAKDVVRVKSVLKIEVIKEGWNEVPLRLSDVAITEATIAGQPARIVSAGGEGYKLLIEKKGKQPERLELLLQLVKAITRSPGQNSVSFEAPQAAVSRWKVRIPEAGIKVNLFPQIAATETADAASKPEAGKPNETVLNAFVGAAPSVRIEWTPKAEGATGLEAMASVQAEQQVTVGEGVTRTRTQLAYSISRAELRQLSIEVPADHKVVNVFDPNVRQWTMEPAGAAQKINVQLFEPAKATQSVIVELERFAGQAAGVPNAAAPKPSAGPNAPAAPAEKPAAEKPAAAKPAAAKPDLLQIPVVRALGVGRQQGVVVVRISEGLRAEAVRSGGLLQVDSSELPPSIGRAPWAFAYRYATVPFDLQLDVQKVQPRVIVDSLIEAELQPERLAIHMLSIYDVQRAGVFRLEFDLPPGFEVRQVRGRAAAGATEAQVDTHHVEGKDKPRLVVNLGRKAMGRVGLMVELSRDLHEADLLAPTGKAVSLPLPLPQVPADGVERATGRLVIHAPESLQINPVKADGLRIITYDEAMQQWESPRQGQASDARPVLAYAFTQEPTALVLSAERRKPQVTIRQLLAAHIDSGVIKYRATFFYEVRYSGVKSLRVDVPKDLASQIRIETPGIRKQQIEPAPANLGEGYVAWSLAGQRDFMGDGNIELSWEPKIEKLVIGATVPIVVPRLKPMDVDRAWGQIVLAKTETIDVRDDPEKQQGLTPIDPQHDLMPGVPPMEAARAFEFRDDWSLSVDAVRYHLEDIKHTSIERALVRLVVTRADEVAVQALYRMRSAEQRLEIQLPKDTEIDTQPRIDGKSVALETEGGRYFVPLVGAKAENSFLLELRYSMPWRRGRLEYPDFPSQPAMQHVYLAVYLPEDRVLLNKRGPWTEEFDGRRDAWNRWRPQSHQTDQRLLSWVANNAPLGETFPTDGRLYLFSAVRPPAATDGALVLTTMSEKWLHGLMCAVVLLGGVILVPVRLSRRFVAIGGLLILLVLLGVFFPIFARQVLNTVLAAAIFLVLVVWAVVFAVIRGRQMEWRRHKASPPEVAGAASPFGAQATTESEAAAEEPASASPNAPADEEGGPSHG